MPFVSKLPGIGGELKQENVLFQVDEIRAIEPDDKGDHWIVTIQKSGYDTPDIVKLMTKQLNCQDVDIGYAGLKDRHATTTQDFSIRLAGKEWDAEKVKENLQLAFKDLTIQLLGHPKRNSKKLRKGLIRGNCFRIVVANLSMPLDEAHRQALKIIEELQVTGVPNYYGVQRIGEKGEHALSGMRSLLDAQRYVDSLKQDDNAHHHDSQEAESENQGHDTENGTGIKRPRMPTQRNYFKWCRKQKLRKTSNFASQIRLNAYQSAYFNILLASRIAQNLFSVQIGDLTISEEGGKVRLVADEVELASVQPEFTFALPVIGCKKYKCTHEPEKIEQEVFVDMPVSDDAFRINELFTTYRPGKLSMMNLKLKAEPVKSIKQYLEEKSVWPVDTSSIADGEGILFSFELPSGSYATSVLREFIKK